MSGFKMDLPTDVRKIIDTLVSHGYTAHVVGGSVRDSFLGRGVGDFDIATSALPSETKALFRDERTIDIGMQHGTVAVLLGGVPYEITTYRVDGDYNDSRHPQSVTFADRIEDDLARRDFTVNAMAYSHKSGICDPFDGVGDIGRRLIRAVGDPYVRFDEDALRILRALRFASVLGFGIESVTSEALRARAYLLGAISKERIYTELKKLVMGKDAVKILREYADVFAPLFAGVEISELPKKREFDKLNLYTRFAAIFAMNSLSASDRAELAFTALKTDKFTRSRVVDTLRAYFEMSFTDVRDTLHDLVVHDAEIASEALTLGLITGKYTEESREVLVSALSSGRPFNVAGLRVRGGDIAALGLKGEKIGEALEMLLAAVIDGEVENEKNMLLDYLKAKK